MGGTSCDVSVVEAGAVREAAGREVGGRPLALPMVDIHTVGAGGGSIAWRDAGGALRVGPRSAGADPGPACYGRGGDRADRHRRQPRPGAARRRPRRWQRRRARRRRRARAVARWLASWACRRGCALGIVRVANAEMVRALRVMTVQRGLDPRASRCWPSAAPARCTPPRSPTSSGSTRILVPPAGGVLSALGLAAADRRARGQRTLATADAARRFDRRGICATLAGAASEIACDTRYRGQAHELTVRDVRAALTSCARLSPRARGALRLPRRRRGDRAGDAARRRHRPGAEVDCAPTDRGEEVAGPTVVALPELTLFVPEGWRGGATHRPRVLERVRVTRPRRAAGDHGALRAACDEMGAALVRSAHSANIKERRDCSTALFDPRGEMVMQAEHIPVHLGAMPAAVAAVLDEHHPEGVSWVLNDPYRGGTHLPDITVITPAFTTTASCSASPRAAPITPTSAGESPGSMPADSTTLDEEGVVIAPRVLDEAALAELSALMRNPEERRADLRAQLAANRIGAARLGELAARHVPHAARGAFAEVLDYAERRTRACLAALPTARHAVDVLEARDGDLELRLAATIDGDELTLDFTAAPRRTRATSTARWR